MVKKIDIQGCIENLTDEVIEQLSTSYGRRGLPRIIMQNATVRSTAITVGTWNELEWMSIKALITWAAANNGVPEITVTSMLSASFGADTVENIDQHQYDEVIKYLVDFHAQMLN